ncbi:3631_t:CDS:2 [Cetraspora pellucida]|uniref:3631_t:CDS:1 n=1 Tax=Cetraspora pellucida TaxID=1433469 RepID=A0ACA9Q0L5_9GLOM|nr:3631_t:CDS:2 [Cetraspora pellucida]
MFIIIAEAVTLYCINKLKEHKLQSEVYDCEGRTVDLTSYNVLSNGTLSEITKRTGGLCEILSEFRPIDLDIEKICFALMDLVSGLIRDGLEEEDWLIKIGYENIILIFDPVVDNIIELIHNQLNMSKQKCSAMFLASGFSESSYLINRIKKVFSNEIPIISVPQNPITAVLCKAVIYGLNKKVITT